MKVVINRCFGGFSVSKDVYKELGLEWDGYGFLHPEELGYNDYNYNSVRVDQRLIAAIEKLGVDKASGGFAELKIVEIPDGILWEIYEYDGMEKVVEASRKFY